MGRLQSVEDWENAGEDGQKTMPSEYFVVEMDLGLVDSVRGQIPLAIQKREDSESTPRSFSDVRHACTDVPNNPSIWRCREVRKWALFQWGGQRHTWSVAFMVVRYLMVQRYETTLDEFWIHVLHSTLSQVR